MRREPTGSVPLFPLRWHRDGRARSQTRGDWGRSAGEHPQRMWVLRDRMDDGEERGRRRWVPSPALQTFRQVRVAAGAFSSWLPLRRPRDGPPGFVVALLPAIWIG